VNENGGLLGAYVLYTPKDMKLGIQEEWNLCCDVACFLILDGGKQIEYARIHGFHKSKVHRIVNKLIEMGIIRKLVRSAYIVYGKGPNWHYCEDRLTPYPLYSGNFIYTINTSMRLHANNMSTGVMINNPPDPLVFSKKPGWTCKVMQYYRSDKVGYSLTNEHENGKLLLQSYPNGKSTLQFRPVNERTFPVSSVNLTIGLERVKQDYYCLADYALNYLDMDIDPRLILDEKYIEGTTDVAFANVSDTVFTDIKSNGSIEHCLEGIGSAWGDSSKNTRTGKIFFEKGDYPEMTFPVAVKYVNALENGETILGPYTDQYNTPSIGQATHNARVEDKS